MSLWCSDQETERVVQGLRDVLPLAQRPAAELSAGQAETDGPLQWHRSRETYLQPRSANGKAPIQ